MYKCANFENCNMKCTSWLIFGAKLLDYQDGAKDQHLLHHAFVNERDHTESVTNYKAVSTCQFSFNSVQN